MCAHSKYESMEEIVSRITELQEQKERLAKKRRRKYLETGDEKFRYQSEKEKKISSELNKLNAARHYRLKMKKKKELELAKLKKKSSDEDSSSES